MDMFLGLAFMAFLSSANALSPTFIRPGNTVFDSCGFNLSATCDDKMRLYADDKLLATSDNWKTTSVVNIPSGTRVIEIHCVDSWIHGGILAASEDNGLMTDGSWSCSSDNRATWKPAYLLGTNGVTAPEISPHAKWIWTEMNTWQHTNQRRHTTAICKIQLEPTECPPVTGPVYPHWCSQPTTLSSTESTVSSTTSTSTETTPTPPGFDLTATCDDKMNLFADGTLLASSDDWKVTSLVNIPADTQVIEIHCMDTGILGGILASSDSGLKTNGTWSCSSDNGTTWTSAYEVGPNGASVPDIAAEASWIWTGCTGDWTAKYTGNKQPNNVICKTILPVTSTSTTKFTSTPTTITPTAASVPGVPIGIKYLGSDLPWASCSTQYDKCRIDKAISEEDIEIAGKTYLKGISAHAASTILFHLGGLYDMFHACIGITDTANHGQPGGPASARFRVSGEDVEMKVLRDWQRRNGLEDALCFDISLNGLEIDDAGDGITGDNSMWADAYVYNLKQPAGVDDGTCYEDEDRGARLLAGYFSRSPTNTPEECQEICYNEGYSYAGVQNKKCRCGNEEPPVSRIRDSSECNMDCPRDAQQKCGGSSRMNIYKTGFMDNYEECSIWKHICTSDEFGDCMNTNCAKTCKLEKSLNDGLAQGFPEVSTIMTAFPATNPETSTQSAMMSTLSLPSINSSASCSDIYVKFIIRDSTTNDVIENATTILTSIHDETFSVSVNGSSDGESLIQINKNVNQEYTVQVSAEGFITFETNITMECAVSQCNLCNKTVPISLSPTIQEGEAHVFINWAEVPKDLDINVVQFNTSISSTTPSCHVDYSNTNCPGFHLDVDNTDGGNNGAETVTFDVKAQNNQFFYLVYVHNYSADKHQEDDQLDVSNLRLSLVSTGRTLHEDMDSTDFNDEVYWIAGCMKFEGNNLVWESKNEFMSTDPMDHTENMCFT